MPELSSLIHEYSPDLIQKIKDAYMNQKEFISSEGVELYQEPFTHGVIRNLVTDLSFIDDLKNDMKSKLKYLEKNNDLYKFHQTSDLSTCKSKFIRKFRDDVLYGSVVKLLEQMTNIELSTKVDFTSSKYEYSDYLLCHDDDIHDDENKRGRRIAFIYYLLPEDWSAQDGGYLDLFKVDENLQPVEIVKSIQPKFNTLMFFEVSDRSFHQVAEVLSKTKTRYSLNGWFHGEINFRPDPYIEIIPEPSPYVDLDASVFFDWLTEKYLQPINQTKIQLKFSSRSEIKLDNIFNSEKFAQVSEALASDSIKWELKGPYHRRNYEAAVSESLPPIVAELIEVLTCDHMGLTLSNMTGLALHSSVPKRSDDEESFDGSYIDSDDDDDDETAQEEEKSQESTQEGSQDDQELKEENETLKRKVDSVEAAASSSKPTETESETSTEPKPVTSSKKFKSDDDAKPSTSAAAGTKSTDLKADPKCYVEVRRWKQGYYTLVTDDDNQIKTKALDLMLFFQCKSWKLEAGGNVSYIARDEDNELLTVNPEENCLALVYRDEETLRFTKYVNTNISDLNKNGCFYEISVVYYE